MDTCFVERLKKRAETMLPPATVMRIECAADAGGDPALVSLLEEVQQAGLTGTPLCTQPCDVIVYDDRVLLRCRGCEREQQLPHIAGIGYGQTEKEAYSNALYALTLPLDKPNARKNGCIAALRFGEGPVCDIQYACIFNRVAYL